MFHAWENGWKQSFKTCFITTFHCLCQHISIGLSKKWRISAKQHLISAAFRHWMASNLFYTLGVYPQFCGSNLQEYHIFNVENPYSTPLLEGESSQHVSMYPCLLYLGRGRQGVSCSWPHNWVKHVHDDAAAPNVTLLVIFAGQNLTCQASPTKSA